MRVPVATPVPAIAAPEIGYRQREAGSIGYYEVECLGWGYGTKGFRGAAAIAAASDEIYYTCPDAVLCHTMGHIISSLLPAIFATWGRRQTSSCIKDMGIRRYMLTALWIPDGVNFLITCRRADFLGGQIERAFDRVREVLGIEVTEEARYEGATRVREFYRALSELLKQFVEKETGVPVLSLETDLADSRSYSAEAMRTRVETFAEMLRARKR